MLPPARREDGQVVRAADAGHAQAGGLAENGKVYVLNMGDPVKIAEDYSVLQNLVDGFRRQASADHRVVDALARRRGDDTRGVAGQHDRGIIQDAVRMEAANLALLAHQIKRGNRTEATAAALLLAMVNARITNAVPSPGRTQATPASFQTP